LATNSEELLTRLIHFKQKMAEESREKTKRLI
jgi:hypothetical protein